MKRIFNYLSLPLFCCFFLIAFTACGPAEQGETSASTAETAKEEMPAMADFSFEDALLREARVISAEGLPLRETAGTEGKVSETLPYLAKVNVVEEGQEKIILEGREAAWYKVRTAAGTEGWVFSGLLDIDGPKNYCLCAGENSLVEKFGAYDPAQKAHKVEITQGLNAPEGARLPCFVKLTQYMPPETSQLVGVSASGKWLAFDEGTEKLGSFTILNLYRDEVAVDLLHDRNSGQWEGDSIRFTKIGEPMGSINKKETKGMIFNNGKVKETGETGKISL